ncbi:hypothetical protein EPUS_00289 [Endocarpon pusillum Z07020]|uniref:Multiple myeloma tumor-associated protein 2-like N-terminal domain-containing protein n=1 Tax=Endocarpon pusillum (strain Z07020 / HMAS-L-300199) TaxID=1263415 RepID=U1FYV5_ENDPU|nr:uncharacterized protein EPUS_00289 [Endocarpon pusillum Z07020]ERF70102.1 hypothetical protein EPUS_00289 [Endocarpon pusillum Z07020]
MDLLTTVRKEGSRGGRGDFKWSDVQSSSHRENYLGHSLMAPVGRWQKGRDLNWYAKGNADEEAGETVAQKAERERKEEIKRIKEAEQDALARALGYDVPPRNPNLETLGDAKEVNKILKEAVEDEDAETSKGVGYGKFANNHGERNERIQGDDVATVDGGQRLREDRIANVTDQAGTDRKRATGDARDQGQRNEHADDTQEPGTGQVVEMMIERIDNRGGIGVVHLTTITAADQEMNITSIDDEGFTRIW